MACRSCDIRLVSASILVCVGFFAAIPAHADENFSAPGRECQFDSNLARGNSGPPPRPQSAGILSDLQVAFNGGHQAGPFEGVEISGERLGFGNKDKARVELRFMLAGMVLDAGYRYFEPGNFHSGSRVIAGSPGSGILGLFGANDDRSLAGGAIFCDAPGNRTMDAVEVYNRLGTELLGARFSPRSGPAAQKLMWRDDTPAQSW